MADASVERHYEPPFLRLPTEIRLHIYAYLLLPQTAVQLLASYVKKEDSVKDYYNYEEKRDPTEHPAYTDLSHPYILMRALLGDRYTQRYGPNSLRKRTHLRSDCIVRDRFRAGCKQTTYHCLNIPDIQDNTGILGTSQQIHTECAELLYSSYTFDFDTHVEALVPFIADLTPIARRSIKSIRIVKRALAYEKEYDRAEWGNALSFLSSNLNIRRLELGIVAGRPIPNGWTNIVPYTRAEFQESTLLHPVPDTAPPDILMTGGGEGMRWLHHLLKIQGLQELDVSAIVEHCPPASNSAALASFIRFSASIEKGFAEFLRDRMLVGYESGLSVRNERRDVAKAAWV